MRTSQSLGKSGGKSHGGKSGRENNSGASNSLQAMLHPNTNRQEKPSSRNNGSATGKQIHGSGSKMSAGGHSNILAIDESA